MNFIPRFWLYIGLVAAIAVIFTVGAMLKYSGAPVPTPQSSLPPAATSSSAGNVSSATPSAVTEAALPPYRGAPVHQLNADPAFLAQVPEAVYKKSLAELADLAVRIAENPGQPDLWMRVAHIKHFYDDDSGARDAYEYLNVIAPDLPVPFYNLALLYGYYLKEPAKAVPKYEAAIRLNPMEASFYIGFADFWREVMGDNKRAEAAFLDGVEKLPGSVHLLSAAGLFYRVTGNVPKAIEYYEKILARRDITPDERAFYSAEAERLKKTPAQ